MSRICWVCGNNATTERFGYPACSDCAKKFDDGVLDPEMLEEVVIASLKEGKLVVYEEIGKHNKEADA